MGRTTGQVVTCGRQRLAAASGVAHRSTGRIACLSGERDEKPPADRGFAGRFGGILLALTKRLAQMLGLE
jgi:hypothetical protein